MRLRSGSRKGFGSRSLTSAQWGRGMSRLRTQPFEQLAASFDRACDRVNRRDSLLRIDLEVEHSLVPALEYPPDDPIQRDCAISRYDAVGVVAARYPVAELNEADDRHASLDQFTQA